ncbi:MAG TPA: glycine zipper 2TM domain-containing protein [Burkholderiaceae bacterium]|jgi:osmotically inducible lipoprotein OsmB|nr:glycine zipper 2TM domain-containing protein [Burkholderiaceae bacterium]
MTQIRRLSVILFALATALVAGCSSMTECQKSTAAGAAIGGVAGNVLTEGSTVGTVGGAVAGGVVGNRQRGC